MSFFYIRMYKCKTISVSQRRVLQLQVRAENQNQTHERFTSHSFFDVSSFKVISMALECRCTNKRAQCLSDLQSALSAFIVSQVYCNCVGVLTNRLRCSTKSQHHNRLAFYSLMLSLRLNYKKKKQTQRLWAWLENKHICCNVHGLMF